MKHALIILATLLHLVSPASAADSDRAPLSPVVSYLKFIVEGDAELRAAIEENIERVSVKGPDADFWRGKTVADLYTFFDDWLVNAPRPTHGHRGIVGGEIVRYSYVFRDMLNAHSGLRVHNTFMGWLALFMNARQQFLLTGASTKYLDLWIADPRVNIHQFIVPPGGFTSFNAFFLRRLKPHARPIAGGDSKSVAVSPVDCKVFQLYDVSRDGTVDVKGETLDFADLLNGDPVAEWFAGGSAFTCNLTLQNYHHFHSPVAGRIVRIGQVGGIYYFDAGFKHLYEHRRAYIVFENEKLGHVALVAVGQVMVNTIRIDVSEDDVVRKGEEIGHFDFGGSEVVLIFQRDRATFAARVQPGQPLWLGQEIAAAR